MSILEKMRSSTDSTGMQIVLVIVIISMFFWFSPTAGDQARTVATVNGTQIRDTEYFPRYRLAYARAQQNGMTPDQEEQLQFQVKQEMARDEALRQIAVEYGFTASDRDMQMAVQTDRRFFNPDTEKFDEEIYKDYRKSRAIQELEKGFETQVLINKLRWSVMAAGDLPESRVRKQYIDGATMVDIQFVRIDPNEIRGGIAIDDAERASWARENSAKVQDRYDRDFKRLYDFPDRVELSVIRLLKEEDGPSEEELTNKINEIRTSVEQGRTMDDMARKWSEDDSALNGGKLPQRRLPTLTEDDRSALADVEEGGLTKVLSTIGSVYFYRLEKRVPAKTIALEQVQDEIVTALIQEERAPAEADAIAKRLLEEWSGNDTAPAEMLLAMGLKLDQSGMTNVRRRRLGGPPEDMIEAALDASERAVLDDIFLDEVGANTVRVVGQVLTQQAADMDQYNTYKDLMYERNLFNLRDTLWNLWVDEQVAKADIVIP